MSFFSVKNKNLDSDSNKNLGPPPRKEASEQEKKLKTLEFIENHSPKEDFLKWIINNNNHLAFSDKDSWEELKTDISNDNKISHKMLRNYAITLEDEKITEEHLDEVVERTEEAEEVVEKLTFLGKFKKFSIAIGGGLFILGLVNLILAAVIMFEPIEYITFQSSVTAAELIAFLLITGITEFLGGILLIST